MALARVKTWNPGDILTAADLNAEFNNLLNNPISLISPTTGALNFNLQAHTNLLPSAISATSGSTGQLLTVSSSGATIWATSTSAGSGLSLVRNLTGVVTSGQTATLQADQYLLQTTVTTPTFFTLNSTAAFTVNVGTAGPIVNGRDVAVVFSSTFAHLYAITTGSGSTTPGGLASTTPPPTGPVMPTSAGYSAWTYLGTFQYSSASTTFAAPHRIRGNQVTYDGRQAILIDGASTAIATVSLSTAVPALALTIALIFAGNDEGTGSISNLLVTTSAGSPIFAVSALTSFASGANRSGVYAVSVPNLSQQVAYNLTGVSAGAGLGCYLSVLGYSVPNGD